MLAVIGQWWAPHGIARLLSPFSRSVASRRGAPFRIVVTTARIGYALVGGAIVVFGIRAL